MSHLELRRLGALLRPGHVVTTKNGQEYEVTHKTYHDHVMCIRRDGNSDSVTCYKIPINELLLREDQVTPADRARVAEQGKTRRQDFLYNLTHRLQGYTFTNLRVYEDNRQAVELCKSLAYGTNLFIYGDSGNGKTMLAVATAHDLAAYYSVAVWSVVEWFEMIRTTFNIQNQTKRPDLKGPEVLVLDDIGKSKASEFAYEELYNVVNYRWEQGKTTIFTSNHSARAAAQKVSPDIDNANTLLSRMASGDVVKVAGRDQRVLQGKVYASAQGD